MYLCAAAPFEPGPPRRSTPHLRLVTPSDHGPRAGPSVVSFGGGVNSSALLVGLARRHCPPDLILFADTGDEWPETYEHVALMSEWSTRELGLPITTVRYESKHGTLERECLTNGTLPSLAFGYRGCSVKWKRQPMDRFVKRWPPALAAWERNVRVERLIGIDAGEVHRGRIPDCKRFVYRRPLITWGWAREECITAIRSANLPVPRKSACWHCPATKKGEVIRLAEDRPDLYDRAIVMEQNALARGGLRTIRGLGRNWSWQELVEADRRQLKLDLFPEAPEILCECFDGEREAA